LKAVKKTESRTGDRSISSSNNQQAKKEKEKEEDDHRRWGRKH